MTLAPSRAQTEPSSSPMTPPPTTTRCSGTLSSASAPVEETIDLLVDVDLDARNAGDVGTGGDDDVLRLDHPAPSPSSPVTATLPAPSTVPVP